MENAIEISYNIVEKHPNKKIYLLSQMIHNQEVNNDLYSQGVRFIMDTNGEQLIPWKNINKEDIVIIPAFGTTPAIEKKLLDIGIEIEKYNTTCPFVEKVWNRSKGLSNNSYTVIIHGKYNHEETRATFARSAQLGPAVVVKNIEETKLLCDIILEKLPPEMFYSTFEGKYSSGFSVLNDLKRLGVINQTTMLASETEEITEYIKATLQQRFGLDSIKEHFADTRDTLCYATNDNQKSVKELLEIDADIAIVVGGYNSSNTAHLFDLCAKKFKAYFINNSEKFDEKTIHHFDYKRKITLETKDWLKSPEPMRIIITSGASCPDTIIDQVILKITSYFKDTHDVDTAIKLFNKSLVF